MIFIKPHPTTLPIAYSLLRLRHMRDEGMAVGGVVAGTYVH